MEIIEFEEWCKQYWGKSIRDFYLLIGANIPQIRDYKAYDELNNSMKIHIAEKMIFESLSRVGSRVESGDIKWYLYNFARELNLQCNIDGFSGRETQPLKAALLLTAYESFSSALPMDSDDFSHIHAGGTALSAMYLMARLENLFRIKGKYLNEDGTPKKDIPQQLKKQLQKKCGIKRRIGGNWRCNRINQSFIIFLYRNGTILGKRLRIIEEKLQISNRLDRIRNPAMHGELDDPGFEADLLGLLIAMFYYSG